MIRGNWKHLESFLYRPPPHPELLGMLVISICLWLQRDSASTTLPGPYQKGRVSWAGLIYRNLIEISAALSQKLGLKEEHSQEQSSSNGRARQGGLFDLGRDNRAYSHKTSSFYEPSVQRQKRSQRVNLQVYSITEKPCPFWKKNLFKTKAELKREPGFPLVS